MYGKVSQKKQLVLGIILLGIILGVTEAFANIWWLDIQNCAFEENEIFRNLDEDKKRQLCIDFYSIRTSGNELISNQNTNTININSLGFRGNEFSINKPDNTYRIIMVGGSTMFGAGASSDDATIPGFFQLIANKQSLDFKIQAINAGVSGANSISENKMIEEKFISYEPDLIIIYDGVNDLRAQYDVEIPKNNWKTTCELGNRDGFDVIVTLQPIAGFGKKILTEQEYVNSLTGKDHSNHQLIQKRPLYDSYAKELDSLKDICTKVADLRDTFDGISEPIYWDQPHMGDRGNLIVAQRLFDLTLPLIERISEKTDSFLEKETSFEEITISNNDSNFKPSSFKTIISYYKTPAMLSYFLSTFQSHIDLTDTSYKEGNYFFIKEQQGEFLMVGADLSGTNLSQIELSNKDLTGSNLSDQDLSGKDLTGTILIGVNLSGANLAGQDLSGKDLSGTILVDTDLSGASLRNTHMPDVDLTRTNLENTDFAGALLLNADLSGKDLTKTSLSFAKLINADLSGSNLSNNNLQGTVFRFANLSNADLSNANLGGFYFNVTLPNAAHLIDSTEAIMNELYEDQPLNIIPIRAKSSGDDLDVILMMLANFQDANLNGANLTGTNLSNAHFDGTDLTHANLLNANLRDVFLQNAILDCLNHPICN